MKQKQAIYNEYFWFLNNFFFLIQYLFRFPPGSQGGGNSTTRAYLPPSHQSPTSIPLLPPPQPFPHQPSPQQPSPQPSPLPPQQRPIDANVPELPPSYELAVSAGFCCCSFREFLDILLPYSSDWILPPRLRRDNSFVQLLSWCSKECYIQPSTCLQPQRLIWAHFYNISSRITFSS